MNRYPYTYIILRYVHDTTTEEFVNVGVILSCPEVGYADAILQTSSARVSKMFPGMNHEHFRRVIDQLQSRFDQSGNRVRDEIDLGKASRNAQELAFSSIPQGDSAFQWSTMDSGLSSDPESTLKTIYERMVTRYEESNSPIEYAPATDRGHVGESPLSVRDRLQKDVYDLRELVRNKLERETELPTLSDLDRLQKDVDELREFLRNKLERENKTYSNH